MTRADPALAEVLPLANAGLTWRLDTRYRERLIFDLLEPGGRQRATVELARVRYSELPERFRCVGIRPATAAERSRLPPHLFHGRHPVRVVLAETEDGPAAYLVVAGSMAAREATVELDVRSAGRAHEAGPWAELARDRGTRLAGVEARAEWDAAPGIEATFAALQERLRATAPVFGRNGVLVGVVDPAGELVSVMANGSWEGLGTLILGRHHQCDICLPDAYLSLRHLALALWQDDAGRLHTRAWDLLTDVPFVLEGGEAARTVEVTGPLFLRLGRYGIAALPLSTALVGAWPTEPQVERLAMGAPELGEVRRARRATEQSAPRPVDGTGDLGDLLERRRPGASDWATVTVRAPGVTRQVPVERVDLERGFLVGRYERCLVQVDHPAVSRVHLLVARIGGRIVAIDAASTNGLRVDGEEERAVELEGRSRWALGDEVVLEWDGRAIGGGARA